VFVFVCACVLWLHFLQCAHKKSGRRKCYID